MWVLHYLNWAGTSEEFRDFTDQMKRQVEGIEGINLAGIFIPTSEWHYVIVWDVIAYEKVLQIYRAHAEKHGPIKMSLGKLELFHTLEEIPFL